MLGVEAVSTAAGQSYFEPPFPAHHFMPAEQFGWQTLQISTGCRRPGSLLLREHHTEDRKGSGIPLRVLALVPSVLTLLGVRD